MKPISFDTILKNHIMSSAFSTNQLPILNQAIEKFLNPWFNVDPAKKVVQEVVNRVYPNDSFHHLRMMCLKNGMIYLTKDEDDLSVGIYYVIDTNGEAYRVQTEAECMGISPEMECEFFLMMMGYGSCPADIEPFPV